MHRRLTLSSPAWICEIFSLRRFSHALLFQSPRTGFTQKRRASSRCFQPDLTLEMLRFPDNAFAMSSPLCRIDHSAVKTRAHPVRRAMFFKISSVGSALLDRSVGSTRCAKALHPPAPKYSIPSRDRRPPSCNDCRSRRTGKACIIFPAFEIPRSRIPSRGNRCRNQICVHSSLRHLREAVSIFVRTSRPIFLPPVVSLLSIFQRIF